MDFTLPYEVPDWIIQTTQKELAEQACGDVFNRAPKQIQQNVEALKDYLKQLEYCLNDKLGSEVCDGSPLDAPIFAGNGPEYYATQYDIDQIYLLLEQIKNQNTAGMGAYVDGITDLTPIGSLLPWPRDGKEPTGFIPCDGRALSKTEYPELYLVIGTTFGGSGDNFNVPTTGNEYATTFLPSSVESNIVKLNSSGTFSYTKDFGVKWLIKAKNLSVANAYTIEQSVSSDPKKLPSSAAVKAMLNYEVQQLTNTINTSNAKTTTQLNATNTKLTNLQTQVTNFIDTTYANQRAALQQDIDSRAKTADVYSKTTIDDFLGNYRTIDDSYSKSKVNELIEANKGLGVGQNWVVKDYLAGVNYTNTGTQPIKVKILLAVGEEMSESDKITYKAELRVGSTVVDMVQTQHKGYFTLETIVPAGKQYSLVETSTPTGLGNITSWLVLQ